MTAAGIIQLHEQGLTNSEIARRVNLGRDTVGRILTRAGYQAAPTTVLPDPATLAAMLKNETATAIGRRYGTTANAVYTKLGKARREGRLPAVESASIKPNDVPTTDGAALPCRETGDPEAYFPSVGKGAGQLERFLDYARILAELTCDVCPIRDACYAGAVSRKEEAGIWGGRAFLNGEPVPDPKRTRIVSGAA